MLRIFFVLLLTLLITQFSYADSLFMFNRTHGFLGDAEVRGAWIGSDDYGNTFTDVSVSQSAPEWVHISVLKSAIPSGSGLVVLMREGACVAKNLNSQKNHDYYEVQRHSGVWRRAFNTEVVDWHKGEEIKAVLIHRPYGHPWSRVQFRFKLTTENHCGAIMGDGQTIENMKIRFRIQTISVGWRLRQILHKTLYKFGYIDNSEYRSMFDIDGDGDIDGDDIDAAKNNPVDFNEDGVINTADSDLHQQAKEVYQSPSIPGSPPKILKLTATWAGLKVY